MLGHRLRAVREDRPRDRLQQDAVFLRKLFTPPQENPAGLVHPVRFGAGGNQADDALLQDLTISGKILVKNDQIEFQSLLAQVGVRLESLLHQFDPVRIGDAQQENRQVTRDTERPQARLAEPVSGDDAGIGAKERIGLNQRAGQFQIHLSLGLAYLQLAQHEPAMRPGHLKGARREAGVAILAD